MEAVYAAKELDIGIRMLLREDGRIGSGVSRLGSVVGRWKARSAL